MSSYQSSSRPSDSPQSRRDNDPGSASKRGLFWGWANTRRNGKDGPQPSQPSMEPMPAQVSWNPPSPSPPNGSSKSLTQSNETDPFASGEVPLPSKEDLLSMIVRTDDEIAQLEHDIALKKKHRDKLLKPKPTIRPQQPVSVVPKQEPSTTDDDIIFPNEFVARIVRTNRRKAAEAEEKRKRLDDVNLESMFDSSLFDRTRDSAIKQHETVRPEVRQRLKIEKKSIALRRQDLEEEYTQKWIEWRSYLLENGLLEDSGDDVLFQEFISRQPKSRQVSLTKEHPLSRSHARPVVPAARYLNTAAVIPPLRILTAASPTDYRYHDSNRVVRNPQGGALRHRQEAQENLWSPLEVEIFVDMYKKVNKDFVKIAAHLPNRSVREVIQFYYINKHKLQLKRYSVASAVISRGALKDSQLALSNPLALDDPDNYGSSVNWTKTNSGEAKGHRTSRRLTTKPSVNYSEKALEQAALGNAELPPALTEALNAESDDEDEEPVWWTELEKERFLDAFAMMNGNFIAIARYLKTKSVNQVKRYFKDNKDKLGLVAAKPKTPKSKKPKTPGQTNIKKSGGVAKAKSVSGTPAPSPPTPQKSTMQDEIDSYVCSWTDDQKSFCVALITVHGRNWTEIASVLSVDPSEVALFYLKYREELNLDDLLPQGLRRTRGGGLTSPDILSPRRTKRTSRSDSTPTAQSLEQVEDTRVEIEVPQTSQARKRPREDEDENGGSIKVARTEATSSPSLQDQQDLDPTTAPVSTPSPPDASADPTSSALSDTVPTDIV